MKWLVPLFLILIFSCKKTQPPSNNFYHLTYSCFETGDTIITYVNGIRDVLLDYHLHKGDRIHVGYKQKPSSSHVCLRIVLNDQAVKIYDCSCPVDFDMTIE